MLSATFVAAKSVAPKKSKKSFPACTTVLIISPNASNASPINDTLSLSANIAAPMAKTMPTIRNNGFALMIFPSTLNPSPKEAKPLTPSTKAIVACNFTSVFSKSLFSPPNNAAAPVAAWNPLATPLITVPNAFTLPSGLKAFISALRSPMSSLIPPNFFKVAIYFSEPAVNPSSSFCVSLNSCFNDFSDFAPSPISTEALYAISIAISLFY